MPVEMDDAHLKEPLITSGGLAVLSNEESVSPQFDAITLGVLSVGERGDVPGWKQVVLVDDQHSIEALVDVRIPVFKGYHILVTCWRRAGTVLRIHDAINKPTEIPGSLWENLPRLACLPAEGWESFGVSVQADSNFKSTFDLRMIRQTVDAGPLLETLWKYFKEHENANDIFQSFVDALLFREAPLEALLIFSYWESPKLGESDISEFLVANLPQLRIALPPAADSLSVIPQLVRALRSLSDVLRDPVAKTQREKKERKLGAVDRALLVKCLGYTNDPEDAQEAQVILHRVEQKRNQAIRDILTWLKSTNSRHAIKMALHPSKKSTTFSNEPLIIPPRPEDTYDGFVYKPPELTDVMHETTAIGTEPKAPTEEEEEEEQPKPQLLEKLQPEKARKIFAEYTDLGEWGKWTILFSGRALHHSAALKDVKKGSAICKKLHELSWGNFSGDNQKMLVGNTKSEVPIYEAKILGDLRLIYQVDLEPVGDVNDPGQELVRQILLIWGLERHQTINKNIWNAIARHKGKEGPDYRKKCLHRLEAKVSGAKYANVTPPATFPLGKTEAQEEVVDDLGAAEQLQMHEIVALSKFVRLSRAVTDTILAQDEKGAQSHKFVTSPREREVIRHDSSSFVIGRSGTGKTTSILYKVLRIEEQYQNTPEALLRGRPRSVFLTQSAVLAMKVKNYYSELTENAEHVKLPIEELARLASERAEAEAKNDLEDLDDESAALAHLPTRFSELTEEHFPLFLSFDTLLGLLEADYGIDWGRPPQSAGNKRAFKSNILQKELTAAVQWDDAQDDVEEITAKVDYQPTLQLWERHVDAQIFTEWFKNFDNRITKNLDPALCWSEILGVICGSEDSVNTPGGYLTEEEYKELSTRTHQTYSDLRGQVYKIFEQYRRKKGTDFDRADRTHTLLRAMRKRPLPLDQQLLYIFVDECQDLLLADCTLIQSLTTNPNAFLYAGDTAQTIASGSAFTFNELRSAVYRLEEKAAAASRRPPVKAELFHLSVNYRSHIGITKVAHSLVEAISELFPSSIDRLEPEKGIVNGPAPVWIHRKDKDSDHFTSSFMFGESGSASNFGAEQCILVRNEEAREKLRKKMGDKDIGLILTIAESKGLEFTDALLYNFFNDSTAKLSEWRIMFSLIKDTKEEKIPSFDNVRHAKIGQELRNLYVAVTRVRNTLWIADEGDGGEPMRAYFESRKVIQTCGPDDELPRMAASSSPAQWSKLAAQLYNKGLYIPAASAWDKANDGVSASRARAKAEQKELRLARRRGGDLDKAGHLRVEALFREAAEKAVDRPRLRRTLFRSAAEEALDGLSYEQAAKDFECAEEFETSAVNFLKARRFDAATRVVIANRDRIGQSVTDRVLNGSRLHHLSKANLEAAKPLFRDDDEALEFMEAHGFDRARRQWLVNAQNFRGVALMDREDGDIRSAATLFQQASDPDSKEQALECLLDLMSSELPLGRSDTWDQPSSMTAAIALEAEASLVSASLTTTSKESRTMKRRLDLYRLITQRKPEELLSLSLKNGQAEGHVYELLALDAALSETRTEYDDVPTVRSCLHNAQHYIDLVEKVVRAGSSIELQDPETQRLLGLQRASEDELLVTATSPLFPLLPKALGSVSGKLRTVSPTALSPIAARFLFKRLDNFLNDQSLALLTSLGPLRPPCFTITFYGACNDPLCRRQHFPPSRMLDVFGDRLQLLGELYRFVQHYDFVTAGLGPAAKALQVDRVDQQRKALDRLLDSLYPLYPTYGQASDVLELKLGARLALSKTLLTLKTVARDQLFRLENTQSGILLPFLRWSLLSRDLNFEQYTAFSRTLRILVATPSTLAEYKMTGDQNVFYPLTVFLASPPDDAIAASTMASAVEALDHIVKKELLVDASVLVHVTEEIAIVATLKAKKGSNLLDDSSFSGIQLPRSLVRRLVKTHRSRRALAFLPKHISHLIDVALLLLQNILGHARQLTIESGPLSLRPEVKPVLALRLLRLLIGLGSSLQWLPNPGEIQGKIHHGVLRIRNQLGVGSVSAAFITAYFNASSIAAMHATSQSFPIDPVTQIQIGPLTSVSYPRGVTVVRGTSLDEVYRLLFPTLVAGGGSAPVNGAKTNGRTDPGISDHEFARLAAKESEELQERIAREDTAARTLQQKEKARSRKKRERLEYEREPFVHFWLSKFADSSSHLVRGPVAELAFAVSSNRARVDKAHKALREEWKSITQDEETHSGLITEAASLKKELTAFDKALAPTSSNLHSPTLTSLRTLLAGLPDLLVRVNVFFAKRKDRQDVRHAQKVAEHFALGVKGLLTLPRPAKTVAPISRKQMRPPGGFNGDDEYDSDYYTGEEDEAEARGRMTAMKQ